MITKKMRIKSILNYIGSVISWTLFSILIICAAFLLYYFVSLKLYEAKGSKYKPFFSVYTIVSPSMVPTINVYDVIMYKMDSLGDIKKQLFEIIDFLLHSTVHLNVVLLYPFPLNDRRKIYQSN